MDLILARLSKFRVSAIWHNFLIVAGALIATLATVQISNHSTLLNGWDDWRSRILTDDSGSHIYFVDIDETSLSSQGRWPWPREKLASLLSSLLYKYDVAVVGVDIILSEPGGKKGSELLGALDKDRIVWAHAASLGNEPQVRQGVITHAPLCPKEAPWDAPVNGWLGLTRDIAGDYFRAGHIRPWTDADQTVRRYLPFLPNGEHCIPALGLAMYATLLGIPQDAPLENGPTGWQWAGIPLGLETSGMLRIIWRPDNIRGISAESVLTKTANIPAGAVVVVGSTAVGIGDFVSSPVSERFTGAGVHALALTQWLDQDFLIKPAAHDLFVAMVLVPLFLAFWYFSTTAAASPWLIWTSMMAAWTLATSLLWLEGVYIASEPVLWALIWLPAIQGFRLWQEHLSSKILYQQFHAYLPEKVLQELIKSKVDPRQLAAESKEVSVLFADLRDFTSISENMPPQNAVALLNEVMEYLSSHIAAADGTLDKFMGDGIMAFWGAPIAMNDHADRAVSCAQEILANLPQFNEQLRASGKPTVKLGMGINSGTVAVGHMGSLNRKNYTAIGDTVNIASRLQQISKEMDHVLLVGDETALRCKKTKPTFLREIELKGKSRRVRVFTCAASNQMPAGQNPGDTST